MRHNIQHHYHVSLFIITPGRIVTQTAFYLRKDEGRAYVWEEKMLDQIFH